MDYKQALKYMSALLFIKNEVIISMAETKEDYIFWTKELGAPDPSAAEQITNNPCVLLLNKQTYVIGSWDPDTYCTAVDNDAVRWIDMETGERSIPG